MRAIMILIWRKITQIKFLFPIIRLIRIVAASKIFNEVLDYIEVNIFHTSYENEREYYYTHKNEIEKILSFLADKKSKEVYSKIWRYRISHDRKNIRGITDKWQYFDRELIKFNWEESFVDCGAYHGETISEFIKRVPQGKYSSIIAFEPDEYNFKRLKAFCKRNKYEGVKCLNKATWDERKMISFVGNTEEACQISNEGNCLVETDTIDHVCKEKKISFIKMDVEGAELKSLQGADEVITRCHPRLAISIYHSSDDMVDIIQYIHQKYPFYKLYVRHYTYFYADTVCYAIDENSIG